MPKDKITRRQLLGGTLFVPHLLYGSASLVEVPVMRLVNRNIVSTAAELQPFCAMVWDEAARAFRACGVELRTVRKIVEICSIPVVGRDFWAGEEMLNVVLTDTIPLDWDNGRSLSGVTTVYDGYHLSVVAFKNAYANRLPFLAVNTVIHELLHVFRGDIFVRRVSVFLGK